VFHFSLPGTRKARAAKAQIEYRVEKKSESNKLYVILEYHDGVRMEVVSNDLTREQAHTYCAKWDEQERLKNHT